VARVRIGLTGGIASGKSTVAGILDDLGAIVIDSDKLSREVTQPGTPGLAQITQRFGDQVLDGDRLDRPALAKIVFDDRDARADLEAILHPAIRKRAAELESQAGPEAVVVSMIPLLVETGQAGDFDSVWVVDADEETQVARLRRRDGMDTGDAHRRIAAQADRADRLAAADVVIDNSEPSAEGLGDQLREQVIHAYDRLPDAR
jgi:dephospho-CoA kinase